MTTALTRSVTGLQTIYGWWVVRDLKTGQEVSRIAGHKPKGTHNWDQTEMGLCRKVDFERFYFGWEDA